MLKTKIMLTRQELSDDAMVELQFAGLGDSLPSEISGERNWDSLTISVRVPSSFANRYKIGQQLEFRIRDLED